MSFDALAPHYRWMEWLLAGGKLQHCRTAFIEETRQARRVLLLGEGNGRFLSAFAQLNRTADITVVDASAGMLRQAKRRAAKGDSNALARVHFLQADVLDWPVPPRQFDLIVTNFFLDCFRPEQLAHLIPRLSESTSENAQWIISDFSVPARGPARWRARWILASMYWFFRVATRLPATGLTPVDELMTASGFQLRQRRDSEWGLLRTDLWERGGGSGSGR